MNGRVKVLSPAVPMMPALGKPAAASATGTE
jgi:hypothetical protein